MSPFKASSPECPALKAGWCTAHVWPLLGLLASLCLHAHQNCQQLRFVAIRAQTWVSPSASVQPFTPVQTTIANLDRMQPLSSQFFLLLQTSTCAGHGPGRSLQSFSWLCTRSGLVAAHSSVRTWSHRSPATFSGDVANGPSSVTKTNHEQVFAVRFGSITSDSRHATSW